MGELDSKGTPPSDYAIASALAAAQAELQDPPRNKMGQVRNGRASTYAGLDDLLQSARPVLSRHGLAVTQLVEVRDGTSYLVSKLIHGSGDSLESLWQLSCTGSAQERGSELTYARRYTLEGLLGVAATDDDDGGGASKGRSRQASQRNPPPSQSRAPSAPPAPQQEQTKIWSQPEAIAFSDRLKELELSYAEACDTIEHVSGERPSAMSARRRDDALHWLTVDEGARDEYTKVCLRRERALEKVRSLYPKGSDTSNLPVLAGSRTSQPSKMSLVELERLLAAVGGGK